MKRESMKVHISPYRSACTAVQSLLDRGNLRSQSFKIWQHHVGGGKSNCLFHLWVAFSRDLDDEFVTVFREHSQPESRLLIVDEGESADTLFTHLVALQIRSPDRFYVADCVGSGKTTCVGVLLTRLAAAISCGADSERILDARLVDGTLRVVSADFKRLDVPVAQVPDLAQAEHQALENFEIDEDGAFVYWPAIDVHLGWEQMEQVVNPDALLRAKQRSHHFNVRYGNSIRKTRQDAGLDCSQIEGLSEKQLRRIESGECRLTSNALHALAKAHKVTPNEFLSRVAKALE